MKWSDEVKARLAETANQSPNKKDFLALVRVKDIRAALEHIYELEWLAEDRFKQLERADEEADALKAKADELVEVICHAAPTGWATSGDLVEASEWEKTAVAAVNDYEAEVK